MTTMTYQDILYEKRDHIVYITLNRPQAINAVTQRLWDELVNALLAFDLDDEAFVAILTGAGDRGFCAGIDVGDYSSLSPETRRANALRRGPSLLGRTMSWKPVIGALHGYVFGIGLSWASECDLLVAADNTRLAIREIKLGITAAGIWARVQQWMPSKVATDMALTGDYITAQEAYRLGLVNEVLPREEVMAAAERMAGRILACPPLAVRAHVRLTRLPSPFLSEAEAYTANLRLDTSEDFREAGRAFAEKRAPVWRGR